jgi:hypothetical protein
MTTMAHVVARPPGRWELRESRSTPAGPRSRTLATFRTLTPAVIEHAQARATKPFDPAEVRKAAVRAGAPVTARPVDRAAGDLLAELATGRQPRAALRRLLADSLGEATRAPSDAARAAAAWIGATPRQRGDALRDLLLLVDRLPQRRGPERPRFPRIASRPA